MSSKTPQKSFSPKIIAESSLEKQKSTKDLMPVLPRFFRFIAFWGVSQRGEFGNK
jgi:hypothetical protein